MLLRGNPSRPKPMPTAMRSFEPTIQAARTRLAEVRSGAYDIL
jgi:hypothetical protein